MALSTGTTRYLLDGLSVIAQYAPSGSRQAFYVQSLARIDEVLSVTNPQGKYWYESDALGSIYALTTATGAVQARGGYDVFGEPVALGGTAVGQPFGFTGREHEADSGLVYARARYLQPGVGGWSRPDPMLFIDGPNSYAYVASSPTLMSDPLGLFMTPVHDLIIEKAFRGYDGEKIASLKQGSYDADHLDGTQSPLFSYMHAMRGPEDSYESAIAHWELFILGGLARAITGDRSDCAPADDSMWELGFAAHALMDLYSPVHRFQVWKGMLHGSSAYHGAYEKSLDPSDVSVTLAVAGLREYRSWYEGGRAMRAWPLDSVLGALMMSYGSWLQSEASFYVSL